MALARASPPSSCLACPLRRLQLFNKVDTDTILEIQAARRGTREFDDRAAICRAGEPVLMAFTMFHGFAIEFRDLADGGRQITRFLLPGDTIVHLDRDRGSWPFSVEAVGSSVTCALSPDALNRCFRDRTWTSDWLVRIWEAEEQVLKEHIVDLGRRPARERVVRQLLELFQRSRVRGRTVGDRCRMPFKQQHIADAVGLTPEYVSRVLLPFRQSGALTLQRGWLRVSDFDAIAAEFGYDPGYIQPRPLI